MATIIPRPRKDGRISYTIRVSDGYGASGQRVRHTKTWTPPQGWSEKRIEKELQKQVVLFEEAVSAGVTQDGGIRFQVFAEQKFLAEYAEKQLKAKTVENYKKLLKRVYTAIGNLRLRDIRTGHLNTMYSNLQEDGENLRTGGTLSSDSVRAYHRVVSSILSKAVKWEFIPYNPAANAELPKTERREAAYLDEADARRLLSLLHDEHIKYRAMITFDLLSGLRRGELLGLRWRDMDFDSETITVVQTSSYVKGRGVYVDTPKNATSVRPLKLSRSAFIMLRQYKGWQDAQREACGDYWKTTDGRVFTTDDGKPISPDSLTQWFKSFIRRHGFPDIHLHSLRHTYASMMIAEGTPLVVVSRRLGHAQVSTTSDIDAHLIKSADEKASQVTEKFADVIEAHPDNIRKLKKA